MPHETPKQMTPEKKSGISAADENTMPLCTTEPIAEAGVEKARLPNQTFLTGEIEQVLAENCTGEDDHDPEPCPKCDGMAEAIVKVVCKWFKIVAEAGVEAEREE